MARQPDIQYVQLYNHGSTARKLAPKIQYRKEKYQLPEQRPAVQQQKRPVLDPLSLCAIVVAGFMLVTMLIGMLRVGELTAQNQQLESYITDLQQQRADLQMVYENSYDMTQVEQRARQMGLVSTDEVLHIQMGDATPVAEQSLSITEQISAFFAELFANTAR